MKVFIIEKVIVVDNRIVYRGTVRDVYSNYEKAEKAVLEHIQDWENGQRMYDPDHQFTGKVVWGTEDDDYYVAYDVQYNKLLDRHQEFRIIIREVEVQ